MRYIRYTVNNLCHVPSGAANARTTPEVPMAIDVDEQDSATEEGHDLLEPEEVSRILVIPLATLYQWKTRGVGPPVFKVGRHLRYRRSELVAWLEEQRAS